MSVVISHHTVAIDAHITKGLLESRGIPAYVNDDQYITMNWTMSHALGGVKVRVPASCYDAATAVLAGEKSGEFSLDGVLTDEEILPGYLQEEAVFCPSCNSDQTAYFDWFRKIALVVLFTFSTPFAFSKRYERCSACGTLFPADRGVTSKALLISLMALSILLLILAATRYLLPTSHYYDADVLMHEEDDSMYKDGEEVFDPESGVNIPAPDGIFQQ